MCSFQLRGTLSDVSDFGENQPLFLLMSTAESLPTLLSEVKLTEELQSGKLPGSFKFNLEMAKLVNTQFTSRYRRTLDEIPLNDASVEGDIAGEILTCINSGYRVIELPHIPTHDGLSSIAVVGIYSLQAHREVVQTMSLQSRLTEPNTHVVSSLAKLTVCRPADLITDQKVERIMSIIKPHIRGNADIFIDNLRTMCSPVLADKNRKIMQGLSQWHDAERLGCNVQTVIVDTAYSDQQIAEFMAREAIRKYGLAREIQIELIIELWHDRLGSNTGKKNGVNMGEKVSDSLGMPIHTANRFVTEARKRLDMNQYKRSKSSDTELRREAVELVEIIQVAFEIVASEINEKDDTERPMLLCEVLRACAAFMKPSYLQGCVVAGRGAA